MNRSEYGALLVVIGIIILLLSTAGSAVLAPSPEVSNSEANQTLIGIQGGGWEWSKYGAVSLRNGNGTETWQTGNAGTYMGVERLENGSILATFMSHGFQQCGEYTSPCPRTGFRLIDPESSEIVFEYSFPIKTSHASEVHEVEQLPSGEFLVADMEYERIFTVNPNKTITWQWNASSHYRNGPEDPTTTDWLHINDVDRIGESRYLVSVRNKNQLLIVERGQGVVEVVNKDQSKSTLRHQHNPQFLSDDTILVADSSNNRIVELERNITSGRWEVGWTYSNAGGVPLDWPRDADRLPNGHTLITDTMNKRIIEINQEGEVVWSTKVGHFPYEADRLPFQEPVGGVSYDASADSSGTATSLPVLSSGVQLLKSGLPVPFWFGEYQLLLTLLSVVCVSTGSWFARQELASWLARRNVRVVVLPLGVLSIGLGGYALVQVVLGPRFTGLYLGVGALLATIGVREVLPSVTASFGERVSKTIGAIVVVGGIACLTAVLYAATYASLNVVYTSISVLIGITCLRLIGDLVN